MLTSPVAFACRRLPRLALLRPLAFHASVLAIAACGSAREPAPSTAGQLVDAARGTPIVGAEIFVNGRTQRVVSDARGYFHATLPRGTTTANLSVYAEGYVRVSVPRVANASGTAIALAAATPARAVASPLAPAAAGTQAKSGAAPQLGHTPTRTDAQLFPGTGSFFSAPSTIVAPGCAACSPFIGGSCCACQAGCPLVGSCGGLPPPPVAGAPFPAGCTCDPSICPGSGGTTGGGTTGGGTSGGGTSGGGTSGGGTSGGAPAPVPDPPPPASYDYTLWAVDPSSAGTAYFNYIAGCLSFADDPATRASSNQDDINFYLTIYPANSTPAANLPVAMLYTGQLSPVDPVETLPTQGLVVADLSAYQAGRRLIVTPGTSCMMMVVLPAAVSSQVSAATTIYSADPATSIYRRRGTGSDGWLYWDPTPRRVLWPVDELNTWQVGKPAYSSGGCMQGLMVNACDGTTPVPRRGVRVNAIDGQGTRAWSSTTDAQGHYCVDTPIDSFWPFLDTVTPQPPVRYVVTGVAMSETAMCDPLPDGSGSSGNLADCRTCQPGLQGSVPAFSLCTTCELVDALPVPPTDPKKFIDTCAPPPNSDPLRQAVLTACSFCDAAGAAREAPTGCQLSDGSTPPISTTSCATLDTTLGFGTSADGRRCTCKFAGSTCDYRNDQCCFVGPLDTSVRGHNQGGCKPGAIEPTVGKCGRCTVGVIGALCNADSDICCNFDDPTMPVACLDSTCIPLDSAFATNH